MRVAIGRTSDGNDDADGALLAAFGFAALLLPGL